MKVTFINPPFAYAAEDNVQNAVLDPNDPVNSTFPIGLAILTAIAEHKGHEVSTVEMPYLSEQETIARVIELAPDVLAFSCWTGNQRVMARVTAAVRTALPRTYIVWGGHHSTLFPQQILESYAPDCVIRGEGEIPFSQLLDERDGGPRTTAPGILRRQEEGDYDDTGPRVRLGQLDDLPMPAYHRYILARDDGGDVKHGAKDFPGLTRRVTILAARGCPYKCSFCVDGKLFSKTVAREVTRVVDEIEFLVNEYDVRLFEFNDMTFTLSQKRTAALCREIMRRGLDISWRAMSRVNVVSTELLEIMRDSGCYSVSFGVETGSEKLLRRIRKQISRDEIIRAFQTTNAVGLSTGMLLMVGNPGETRETISETIDLIYRANPTEIDPSIYQVYPGSATYRELKASGYIDDSYWLNHDAAPYFTGEHPFSKLRQWQQKLSYHHKVRPRDKRFFSFFRSTYDPTIRVAKS